MEKIKFDFSRAKNFFEDKINFLTSPFELKRKIENEINTINIIDVRKYDDYIIGHIPFAEHIPLDDIDKYKAMLEEEKLNIIYCYSDYCKMAHIAALKIAQMHFPVSVLRGGIKTWEKIGYEIIKNSSEN